ncbi:mitochondrial genome maintenance exonuclease 1-like isoform X2 [Monodon monoceros]|uniref:mitochondrial genome maintenance exonuclease 1-like isoform X2 n=1 Tax=Monodon monoceros TaxID=40151 RepID=UPI0010F764D2|nr:mitochondrial genome maintenance exonuclease 1-like isoform X2 [Monodon monoceros]
MKVFQTICRQLISSKGFSVEPAPSVVFSTSSYMCGRKKKVSRYEEEDPKKYSDLVRSVLSFRGHAQTPQPLFEEDALLYGPVRKCKAPKQEEEAGGPRNWGPLFNPEKSIKPNDPTVPLKIPLQRNMIPRVTRVLQQTMNSEQISCLERWKQWVILELREDCLAEYTSSSVWLDRGGLQRRVPRPPTFRGRRALLPVLGKVTSTRRIYKEGKEPEYSETRLGAGSCVGTFRTFSQFGKIYCCFL